MKVAVRLVPSADKDLDKYDAYQQKIILRSIARFLQTEPEVESRRKKQLRPNPLAPWELGERIEL